MYPVTVLLEPPDGTAALPISAGPLGELLRRFAESQAYPIEHLVVRARGRSVSLTLFVQASDERTAGETAQAFLAGATTVGGQLSGWRGYTASEDPR